MGQVACISCSGPSYRDPPCPHPRSTASSPECSGQCWGQAPPLLVVWHLYGHICGTLRTPCQLLAAVSRQTMQRFGPEVRQVDGAE